MGRTSSSPSNTLGHRTRRRHLLDLPPPRRRHPRPHQKPKGLPRTHMGPQQLASSTRQGSARAQLPRPIRTRHVSRTTTRHPTPTPPRQAPNMVTPVFGSASASSNTPRPFQIFLWEGGAAARSGLGRSSWRRGSHGEKGPFSEGACQEGPREEGRGPSHRAARAVGRQRDRGSHESENPHLPEGPGQGADPQVGGEGRGQGSSIGRPAAVSAARRQDARACACARSRAGRRR